MLTREPHRKGLGITILLTSSKSGDKKPYGTSAVTRGPVRLSNCAKKTQSSAASSADMTSRKLLLSSDR